MRLELELDPDVDLVSGDERRIRQVVFNLLSNAVKFTPEGGKVDVSTARQDGEVLVSVSDTGPGISLADQARIFEEFQQAKATNAERPEGTDSASPSPQPGRAARRPHLGRVGARPRLHIHVHDSRRLALMAGLRVLVVEDNEKNMKLFRDVLQAKGYDPLEAVSGEEAVELATERPGSDPHGRPASGMDGIEALGRIRADERTSIPWWH